MLRKKWYFVLACSIASLSLLNASTLRWLLAEKVMNLHRHVIILHVDGEKMVFQWCFMTLDQ